MSDPAGLPALQDAIRHLYGLEATWLESVPVHEQHNGATVWQGEVQVFAVEHPKASRCYAWSHESGAGGKRPPQAALADKLGKKLRAVPSLCPQCLSPKRTPKSCPACKHHADRRGSSTLSENNLCPCAAIQISCGDSPPRSANRSRV